MKKCFEDDEKRDPNEFLMKSNLSMGRFRMSKERHKESLEKAISDGLVDEQMIGVCREIAATTDFFTSSSCAGRILLLDVVREGVKKDSFFHRKWHREVFFDEVLEGVKAKTKGTVWLRAEPFIFHIGCRDLAAARKVLLLKDLAGVRRGGICVAKEGKFIVELTGTQYLCVPVKEGERILVDEKYLKELVSFVNRRLKANFERLEKFRSLAKEVLK